ncbi:MAG: Vgb family protein [Candidatus Dormibacteria bacterium]
MKGRNGIRKTIGTAAIFVTCLAMNTVPSNAQSVGCAPPQIPATETPSPQVCAMSVPGNPLGVVIDNFGNAFYTGAPQGLGELQLVDPRTGTYQPASTSLLHPDSMPVGIAYSPPTSLSPQPYIWLAEYTAGEIVRVRLGAFNQNAVSTWYLPTPNASPFAVAVDSQGNCWFTETGAGKIGKIDLFGTLTEYSLFDPNAAPHGIAIEKRADGDRVWFSETVDNQLGVLIPHGNAHPTINEFPLPQSDSGPMGVAIAQSPLKATGINPPAPPVNGVATPGATDVYVTEYGVPGKVASGQRIGRLTVLASTALLQGVSFWREYSTGWSGAASSAFSNPFWIASSPTGDIWYTESKSNRIGVLHSGEGVPTPGGAVAAGSTPSGAIEFASPRTAPTWITVDPNNGDIWLVSAPARSLLLLRSDSSAAPHGTIPGH